MSAESTDWQSYWNFKRLKLLKFQEDWAVEISIRLSCWNFNRYFHHKGMLNFDKRWKRKCTPIGGPWLATSARQERVCSKFVWLLRIPSPYSSRPLLRQVTCDGTRRRSVRPHKRVVSFTNFPAAVALYGSSFFLSLLPFIAVYLLFNILSHLRGENTYRQSCQENWIFLCRNLEIV